MARPILAGSRLLNHTELIYAPGERELAGKLFELLGCRVEDGGSHLIVIVDPASECWYDNCLYASEMLGEQQSLEGLLEKRLADDPQLRAGLEGYRAGFARRPEYVTHFGIRIPSREALEEILERIENAEGDLAGRIEVVRRIEPGDADALDPSLIQVFVRTDVCAAGLLTLGGNIELQVSVA